MMALFIIISCAVVIFTARTPEEWEEWINNNTNE